MRTARLIAGSGRVLAPCGPQQISYAKVFGGEEVRETAIVEYNNKQTFHLRNAKADQ